MPANRLSLRLIGAGFLAAALGGCATTTAPPLPVTPDVINKAPLEPASEVELPKFILVVRYARYTLVELAPMAAQRDLLLQTIDVSISEDARATVGDALRHVLKRSGYVLCQNAHAVIELYALPLPAAHLRLGPHDLCDVLLTLAGPAWELHADDRARQICFERSGDSIATNNEPAPPAPDAAQTFQLAPAVLRGQPECLTARPTLNRCCCRTEPVLALADRPQHRRSPGLPGDARPNRPAAAGFPPQRREAQATGVAETIEAIQKRPVVATASDPKDTRQALEARAAQPRAPSKPAACKAEPPPLPFRIVGAELRAGERSVSVAPSTGNFTPDHVQVLLPGDALGPWCLQAVDGNAAVFQASDQTRREGVP